jgi:hypothetical protein
MVHASGFLHHQRLPSLLGLATTNGGSQLKISTLRLTPVAQPKLVQASSAIRLNSPALKKLGQVQFTLLDFDRDNLDELLIFERDGIEFFKARGKAYRQFKFLPIRLKTADLSNNPQSQFLYDTNSDSWQFFSLKRDQATQRYMLHSWGF